MTDRIKNGSTMLYNGQHCSDPALLRNSEEIAQKPPTCTILFLWLYCENRLCL